MQKPPEQWAEDISQSPSLLQVMRQTAAHAAYPGGHAPLVLWTSSGFTGPGGGLVPRRHGRRAAVGPRLRFGPPKAAAEGALGDPAHELVGRSFGSSARTGSVPLVLGNLLDLGPLLQDDDEVAPGPPACVRIMPPDSAVSGAWSTGFSSG